MRILRDFSILTICGAAPLLAAQQGAVGANVGQAPPPIPEIRTGALIGLNGLGIRRISIRNDAANAAEDHYAKDDQRLLERLSQKPGQKADASKLRDDLRSLYASGKYTQISVEGVRGPDNSVDLTYHVLPQYFVGQVFVTGTPQHTSADRLINSTKLQLGEPVKNADLDYAVQRIRTALAENGWHEPQVTYETVENADTQQEQVTFRIVRGTQARIGTVTFKGDSGYSQKELEKITKLHPGHKITGNTVDRALTRLRNKMQKQDRLESQVAMAEQKYDSAKNIVDYTLEVNRGPKVSVKVEGAKIRKGKLKKVIPVYEENAVDEDLLNEGRRNLRDIMQTKGYFDASVAVAREQKKADQSEIIFQIDKGDRHKIAKVEIVGNKYFRYDDLRERMAIQPADLLLRQGLFSQSNLTHDVNAIENLYKANGFANVKVTPEIVDNYGGKNGSLDVRFHVNEGTQVRITALDVQGVTLGSPQEVRLLLSDALPGQPYSPANIATDRDAVVNYYYRNGFPRMRFETSSKPTAGDPNLVDVVVKITEGEQIFIDRTLISGLHFTRPTTVDRKVTFSDGQPLDQTALLNTQRGLYDLSLFNEVDEAVQNPRGNAAYKNVIVNLQEARRYTFTYGLGFEAQTGAVNNNGCQHLPGQKISSNCNPNGNFGFSPRASFEVSRINLRGTDQSITFKGHYGRLQKRALLSYTDPNMFNRPPFTFTATIYYDDTQDVLTFSSKRLEGQLQVKQQYSKAISFVYRYAYRRVEVNQLNITPDQVPLLSLPVNVGMPGFTFVRDTRDDPLDSHRGTYNTADLGLSATAFGSRCTGTLIGPDPTSPEGCPDPNFSRIYVQNTSYYMFGKTNRKWVLARTTVIGSESPFGKLGGQVPLAERFYSGGSNSHRGFAINQAGPRDNTTGYPIGGQADFLNSVELRTPPIVAPIVNDNLSAVFFHDMGNAFDTTGHMFSSLFRFSQPHQTACATQPNVACDFNYNANAIGVGLRYRTPIGPIRVDFGFNLNPPLYHRTVVDPSDPTGNTTVFQTTHTNRFIVFFSIGQAY